MVSINIPRDKFDKAIKRIKNRQFSERKDNVQITLTAKSSLPFSIDFVINSHERPEHKLCSVDNHSTISCTVKIPVEPTLGLNNIDIIFSCVPQASATQKSIELNRIAINDTTIRQSNFGMDRVDFQPDDMLHLTKNKQQEFRRELSGNHGGYFGFFGRVRIPYYRFTNSDDVRIYKRADHGLQCGDRRTIVYDDPPKKTKDILKKNDQ